MELLHDDRTWNVEHSGRLCEDAGDREADGDEADERGVVDLERGDIIWRTWAPIES